MDENLEAGGWRSSPALFMRRSSFSLTRAELAGFPLLCSGVACNEPEGVFQFPRCFSKYEESGFVLVRITPRLDTTGALAGGSNAGVRTGVMVSSSYWIRPLDW